MTTTTIVSILNKNERKEYGRVRNSWTIKKARINQWNVDTVDFYMSRFSRFLYLKGSIN